MTLLAQNIPVKKIHYSDVQIDEDGNRFVLCKNCREKIYIGNSEPYWLGNLCSRECEIENEEFYR